jgi:hypothetical protein
MESSADTDGCGLLGMPADTAASRSDFTPATDAAATTAAAARASTSAIAAATSRTRRASAAEDAMSLAEESTASCGGRGKEGGEAAAVHE